MSVVTKVGETLSLVLREGLDIHRCAAAQALGRIGWEGAVEPLIESLRDEDEDVRVDAVGALAAIGHPRAGAALLDSLIGDPCGDVKVAAAAALGRLRERKAIPVLRQLVRGREGDVLWDEEDFLSDGWDDWLDVQLKAIEALGAMGVVEAVPDIVAAIEDEMGQDVTPVAFPALARLGDAGIEALSLHLRSGGEGLRRRAAQALGEVGTKGANQALASALDDASAEVRLIAVDALAARDPGAPFLLPLFEDSDPGVRCAMVRHSGRRWPERLHLLLDDPSAAVQAEVVALLAASPDLPQPEDLIQRLRVKLRGPSKSVAVAVCGAVVALAPEDCLADLAEQLQDARCPAELRCAAARALGDLPGEEAVRALVEVVDDNDRQLRIEAISALARIARADPDSASASAILLGALRGELVPAPQDAPPAPAEQQGAEQASAPAVQEGEEAPTAWPKSTLDALSRHEDEAAAAPSELPGAVELDERDLELLALAKGGPKRRRVVPLDPQVAVHEDVRRFAARVLGDVANDPAAEALAEVLDDEDVELRRAAADSLARLVAALGGAATTVVERLIRALEDPDRDVRLAITRALGHTGNEVVPALVGRLEDQDSFVRADAARALARLEAVGPEVAELLADEYPGVRTAAAEALAAQGGPASFAQLVEFTFAREGMHRREAAALLRGLDRDLAGERFLDTLGDDQKERFWQVAIEALEELYRPAAAEAVRMVA